LKINVFNGEPVDWPEWQLSFQSLIEENPNLTNSQKLGYLKTFLGEEPRSKVLGLLLGNDYAAAMQELKYRYGNPTLIIEAYINKVRQWPRIQKNTELPDFCTQVSQLVQIFQTMGYAADLEGKGLLVDLTSRLPYYMKESWGRYVVTKGKGDPNVMLFHKGLLVDLTSRLPYYMKESWGRYVVTKGKGDPNVMLFHEWLIEKEKALRYGGALDTMPRDVTKNIKSLMLVLKMPSQSRLRSL
jgi:hypothetical protein